MVLCAWSFGLGFCAAGIPVAKLKAQCTKYKARSSLLHDPAIFETNNPVAIIGIRLRVRYLNDGGARFVKALEHLHDLFALAGMQITRRLVRKDHLGLLVHPPPPA